MNCNAFVALLANIRICHRAYSGIRLSPKCIIITVGPTDRMLPFCALPRNLSNAGVMDGGKKLMYGCSKTANQNGQWNQLLLRYLWGILDTW